MGKYSIKELEQLSGIKAHTIRMWEKRHRLIEPSRTQTNIRFYSDEDLKKIISVSLLNNNGLKISKIVKLTTAEISHQVEELSQNKEKSEIYQDQLVLAMIDLGEEQFEKIIGTLSLKYAFEKTVLDFLYPFLEKIGILWLTNNITPAQEHFVTNLIRQKLIVAIDNLPLPPATAKRAILFLPENELHELGLLFYYYLTKKAGIRTFYLGQTVPYPSLKSICEEHNPDLLVSSFTTHPLSYNLQNYINTICTDFKGIKILISGYQLKKNKIEKPSNLEIFEGATPFKSILMALK